jgi:hypothetical protein
MSGTTRRCAHCGRPIINGSAMAYGNAGEVYHAECTRPPQAAPTYAMMGCVCPPGSEATCQGYSCPRKPPVVTTY